MNIGDLVLRLLADGSTLAKDVEKEAQKAGDAGAKTLGSRLSKGLATKGVQAFGVAAAGAFAIATKGALELSQVQANFQAETGASAEEAKHAAEVINRVAGSQRVSLETVSDAAVHVRRDLGLIGPEADRMTETIVKFARVTKQDAGGAVKSLDDILDSWGLTAKDADNVLNKLLVSQHKFGGEIGETSATLAALAPAMRAANLTIDDGIGLLGLFGAKGLDAGQASAAFAKALTKVKSPHELQALITDISNTEDPFLRASKAADLFGAKAGAKLANALGGANLADFAISADEAAGAVDKAANALDSTFNAQLQKKISEASASLRQFGADFGPAVTGAASLATLAASLGGGKLVGGLTGALKGVWLKVAASSVVSGAVAKAGSVAATAYLQALITGDKVSSALQSVMGSAKVGAASSKLGSVLGSTAGKAFAVGFAAFAIVEMLKTEQDIIETTKAQLAKAQADIDKQVATGTTDQLQQSKAALEQGIKELNGVFDLGLISDPARKNLENQLAQVTKAIDERGADWRESAKIAAQSVGQGIDEGSKDIPATIAGNLEAGAPAVTAATGTMLLGIPAAVEKFSKLAREAAAKTPYAIAEGIKSARAVVTDAMSELRDAMLHEMSPAAERAKLIGDLTGKELAKALRSKDPVVRAAGEHAQSVMLERLEKLVPANGKLGRKAMEELAKAAKSKDPVVRAAVAKIKATVERKLEAIRARKAGQDAGSRLRKGLLDKNTTIGNAARAIGRTIARRLLAGIKAGVGGNVGGKLVGDPTRAAGGPVTRFGSYRINERRQEYFVPKVSGHIAPDLASFQALMGMQNQQPVGGDTYSINVAGALPVRTTKDVVTVMRRISDARIAPKRRAAPMYPIMPGRVE